MSGETVEGLMALVQQYGAAQYVEGMMDDPSEPGRFAVIRDYATRLASPAGEVTDAQIEAGWKHTFSTDNPFCPCNLKSFTKAVRWREAVSKRAKP